MNEQICTIKWQKKLSVNESNEQTKKRTTEQGSELMNDEVKENERMN